LTFTAEMVRCLLRRQGVSASQRRSPAAQLKQRDATELTIAEAAVRLGMPENTLYRWMRRGLVTARKVQVLGHSLWLIRADPAELNRLRQRRERSAARPTTLNAS
jgi:excisionase family DNA binding protein